MMYYNNRRLVLSIIWTVAGIALVALSVLEVLDSTLYSGFGGGLAAVGILQLIKNLKYRKDPAYREAVDIEVKDERSSFIRMKSWACTGFIVVLAEGIGAIIAMVLGYKDLQMVLSWSLCLIIFVYWAVYLVMRKKY